MYPEPRTISPSGSAGHNFNRRETHGEKKKARRSLVDLRASK
jgi:hypothetical protein